MFYIRTDMNSIIATGHVMRCLSIADAMRKSGEEVTFILADTNAVELLSKRRYNYIVLNTKWNDMESELEELKKIIRERSIDKILIDSYQVTKFYLETVRKLVRIVYIDDLNAFDYPVDTLICYANYWRNFSYEQRYNGTKLLLGTEYAPIREVFQNCERKYIKDKIENILILSGGTDKYNIIKALMEKLPRNNYQRIYVICGKYYEGYEALKEQYREEKNIVIKKAVSDIEKYMSEADVAITAGGTTLYELCAMGTPAISFSFVDNQLDNVIQFQKDGIIDYAGDIRNDNVIDKILVLLENYSKEKRCKQSRDMQALVDGMGALRIAKALMQMEK